VLSAALPTTGAFTREHLRAPLTLVMLIGIPIFFVFIFASVVGEFAEALGGTLASQAATAISAGWAAAFLSGVLGFFQVSSSRGADRRLAIAGLGPGRVAVSRMAAALAIGITVSAVAFFALWLRSGIGHPLHAAAAILSFAVIYIGLGALIGAFVKDALSGSLLVMGVFFIDAFSNPQMTSSGAVSWTPTRAATNLLVAAGGQMGSPGADWLEMAIVAAGALAVAIGAFWLAARGRS
jgi:hypothetical protein